MPLPPSLLLLSSRVDRHGGNIPNNRLMALVIDEADDAGKTTDVPSSKEMFGNTGGQRPSRAADRAGGGTQCGGRSLGIGPHVDRTGNISNTKLERVLRADPDRGVRAASGRDR